MNYTSIYLGSVPNDRTGDTLRSGGMKINRNFNELFWASPQRHRQSPLVYKQTAGISDFISYLVTVGPASWENTVDITLKAPFVAAIGAGNDERGERNLSVVISTDATPSAWRIHHVGIVSSPTTYNRYLYVERNFTDLTCAFGFSTLAPTSDQVAPVAPATDQHWFDKLNGVMKRWNGTSYDVVYRIFINTFTFVGPGTSSPTNAAGPVTVVYEWDNDELADMRRIAIQSAIVFG